MLEAGKTREILDNFESGLPSELIECFFFYKGLEGVC